MNEEKEIERKEVILIEKEKKYTVFDWQENEVKRYVTNKRQFQKYKAVKFYKGNGAINFLGKRNKKFKGIIEEKVNKDE